MSDCEASEVVWESLFSPGKKKRKKKVKPSPIRKANLASKSQGNNTSKKNSKFKEAMDERKAKRKEKKKKKKDKLAAKRQAKIVNDDSNLVNKNLTPDAKKRKRKKQVAFDIPHNYIQVKRPKFSSFLLPPQGSTSPVSKVMVESEMIEPSQAKPSDSQSTNDDMHSQDLFITQKTFRVPLSELSSQEASDKFEDNTKVAQIFYRETKCLFQTQKIKPKTELCHENVKRSPKNPFLAAPIVVSRDREKKDSIVLSPLSHSGQQQRSMISSFTQTENFFTTELSLYLNFCQKSKSNAQSDEVKPLDLSLPNRARRDFNTVIIDLCEDTNVKENPTVSHGGSVQPSWPIRGQGKEEATPSPLSESEQKSADTTTSSEDNEALRTSKMQVRAVQMRLNESFFFKAKGEGPSPRAESPLMKLVQGRELKSRKPH